MKAMAEIIVHYPDRNGVSDPANIEGRIVGELVRCRDCKFWYKDECSHLCAITGDLRPEKWFCADAERRTDK